jgi:hypothetical protein
MKSNVQLRRDDSDDEMPIAATMPVAFPDMASSSQTVPPSEPDVLFTDHGDPCCHSGGNERYAGDYVLHAAGDTLHQPACKPKPAGPSGVPEVSSSWQ